MTLICFDLDGTLVDPMPAIKKSLEAVCKGFGLPEVLEETIQPHIGPGIQGLFQQLFQDPDERQRAAECYWQTFKDEGVVRHRLYDGVPLLLSRLRHQGHRLLLVTAKPTSLARQVAHHLDFYLAFDGIHGSELGGPWRTKSQLLGDLRLSGALEGGGMMVGDRAGDMLAALDNGLRPVGVTYGYGTREELESAGAGVILSTIPALDAWLQGSCPGSEKLDAFALSE